NYTGPLPEPLASILDPIQYFLWEGEQDNLGLITELKEALKHLPVASAIAEAKPAESPKPKPAVQPATAAPAQARPPALEAIGGAVPLDSEFYVSRIADGELLAAISKRDSIILIKGARQMGKTSMLARGLQYAREQGVPAVSTDLQKFNAENFKSVD